MYLKDVDNAGRTIAGQGGVADHQSGGKQRVKAAMVRRGELRKKLKKPKSPEKA